VEIFLIRYACVSAIYIRSTQVHAATQSISEPIAAATPTG